MKFASIICVLALIVLAYSQPLVDLWQPNNRPFPTVKNPLQLAVLRPTPQVIKQQEPVVENDHLMHEVDEVLPNIDYITYKAEVEYFNGKEVSTPMYSKGQLNKE